MNVIAAFLVGLWFTGLLFAYTLGGAIHLLLGLALALALRDIIRSTKQAA